MGAFLRQIPLENLERSLSKDAKTLDPEETISGALETIRRLRDQGTRVHSITNTVAQNFTANVLLACNARPSMTINPDEVEAFTTRADGLHINLGTLDQGRMEAIGNSVSIAGKTGKPVVLDPVMAHVSPLRAEFAKNLAGSMSILRGNGDEISLLKNHANSNVCVVETGNRDAIAYKGKTILVENGHPMMAQVIATGCALGGLITALATKTQNMSHASLAGLLWFGIAGETAAQKADGPGSFSVHFIDALYSITEDDLRQKAKVVCKP